MTGVSYGNGGLAEILLLMDKKFDDERVQTKKRRGRRKETTP
jgi:hypothetical protein